MLRAVQIGACVLCTVAWASPAKADPGDEYLLRAAMQTLKYKEESHFKADVKRFAVLGHEQLEMFKGSAGLSIPLVDALINFKGDVEQMKKFRELLIKDESAAWKHDIYRELQITCLNPQAIRAYKEIRDAQIKYQNRGVRLKIEAIGDKHIVATVDYLPQQKGAPEKVVITGVHTVNLRALSSAKLVEKAELSQFGGLTTVFERIDPESPSSVTVTFNENLPLHEGTLGIPKIAPPPCPVAGQYLFQDVKDAPTSIKCIASEKEIDKLEITGYDGKTVKATFDLDSMVLRIAGPKGEEVGHLLASGVILITPADPKLRYFWNRPGTPREKFPW